MNDVSFQKGSKLCVFHILIVLKNNETHFLTFFYTNLYIHLISHVEKDKTEQKNKNKNMQHY